MTRVAFTTKSGACVYVVRGGDVALTVEVHDRMVGPLALHVGFPYGAEGEGAQAHLSEWVDGGRCYGRVSWLLYADDVWKRCGGKLHSFDQGEYFWRGLGAEMDELIKKYRERAAACSGEGI